MIHPSIRPWVGIARLRNTAALVALMLAGLAVSPADATPITIDWVTVGDPGNAADTTGAPNPAGAVAASFQIMKFEFTNAHYKDFLNFVAATDTYRLYNANMGSNARGGITRSGASGSYTYAVKSNMGDKPVNYVSWFDAGTGCELAPERSGLGQHGDGCVYAERCNKWHCPSGKPGSVVPSADGRSVVQGGVLQGRQHERGLLGLRHAERYGPDRGDGGLDRHRLCWQHGQLRQLRQCSRLEQPNQHDDGGHQRRGECLRCLRHERQHE